jgi:predicted permease
MLFGRLKPGVALDAARTEAQLAATEMFGLYPDNWNTLRGVGRAITILSESESRIMPPDARLPAIGVSALLLVVVGLVLLIVCFNLANLLLARATGRRREIAIRLSLGASRGRVIQQLLAESLLLAVLGTGLGLGLTVWITDLIGGLRLDLPLPLYLDLHPDGRVLLFAIVLSMVTGVLLGLAPALQATRPVLVPALKDEGSGGMTRTRLRGAFVVAQVGLSLVLLIAAGLFLRSLRNAAAINPGFEATRGLLVPMDLSLTGYSAERGAAFQRALLDRVRAVPAVEEASLATTVPLSIDGTRQGITIEGYTAAPGEDLEFGRSIVGPRFFEALGIPMVRGRGFTGDDAAGRPGVAVVNESFARRFWGGENPVGKRISVSGDEGPFLDVVGIAKDGKYGTLGETARPFFFLPLLQHYNPAVTLVVRTATPPATLAAPIRSMIHELDANLLLGKVTTLEEHVGFSLLPARVAGAVLGGFGMLGLLLATLGIYGVVAFAVSQRTREIGIRMALGAQAADVVRLVVRDGMRLVAIGLAVGVVIALPLSRLLSGWLYGLSPTDPLTFVAMPMMFATVALVASLIPSRRAARLDPLVALRAE